MIFILIFFTLLDIDPAREDRNELLMEEATRRIENFDRVGFLNVYNSLKRMGLKKEAKFLMGVYLINQGDFTKASEYLSKYPVPPFIDGILNLHLKGYVDVKQFKELPDTTIFKLIFYLNDTTIIDTVLKDLFLPPIYDTIALAYKYYIKGKYRKASSLFMKVLPVYHTPLIQDYLYSSLIGANLWSTIVEVSSDRDYKTPILNFAMGSAFYHLKKYKEAERFFSAGTSGVFREHFLFGLGWTEYRLKKYKDCVRVFEAFMKSAPPDLKIPGMYRLGRAYLKMGDLKSIELFRKIVDDTLSSSFDDDALFLIGKVYYVLNQGDSARKYLLRTILDYPLSPWSTYAARYIGDIFQREGDYKKAERYYDLALKFYPPAKLKDELVYLREYMGLKMGKYRSTLEFYNRFLKEYPENSRIPEVLESMGDLYISMRRYKKGIEVYKLLLEKYPDEPMPEVAIKIFRAYQKLGKDEEGVKFLDKYINEGCSSCDELFRTLGDYFMDVDQTGKAIEYYRKINVNDLKPYALFMIGKAYFNTGFYRESRTVLEEVLNNFAGTVYYDKSFLLKLKSLSMEGLEEDLLSEVDGMGERFSMNTRLEANLIVARYFCDREDSRAFDYYSRAIELSGTNIHKQVDIYLEAADCSEKMGLLNRAEDFRKKAELLSR